LFLCILKPEAYAQKLDRSKTPAQLHIMNWHPDLAHVLLAQHQHRGFVSALITTMAPGDDIWDPPRVALKLPSVVDKGLLIQESGLFMFCPPFMPNTVCTATHGDQPVVQDALRDARSGDSFLCVAETLPLVGSEVLSGSDSLSDIHSLFDAVGRVVTSLVKTVVQASHSFPEWTQQVDQLQSDFSSTIVSIETSLTRFSPWYQSVPARYGRFAFDEPCSFRPLFLRECALVPSQDDSVQRSPVSEPVIGAHLHDLFKSCHTLEVPVWYVDPFRFPVCKQCRSASLAGPDNTWFEALTLPWSQEIWPQAEVQVVLFQTFDKSSSTERHTHVILLQHSLPGLMPVMLSNVTPHCLAFPRRCVILAPMDLTAFAMRATLVTVFPEVSDRDDYGFSFQCGDTQWSAGQRRDHFAVTVHIASKESHDDSPAFLDDGLASDLQAAFGTDGLCLSTPHASNGEMLRTAAEIPCPGFPA